MQANEMIDRGEFFARMGAGIAATQYVGGYSASGKDGSTPDLASDKPGHNVLWENQLQKLLGIRYPLIQAPMLGVTSPQMVAGVSNAGGLGSLPVGGLSPAQTSSLIAEVKQLTKRPFAVNLFADSVPASPVADEVAPMQDFLERLGQTYGLSTQRIAPANVPVYSYHEQIDCLIEQQVPVVSFTFGMLDEAAVQKLKSANVRLIGTATCLREATLLADSGVDAVVAQGIEAGGHRASFLDQDSPPQIPTMILVAEMAERVKIAVIAAGGLANGRSIVAAHVVGAEGFQVGSLFLRSKESNAPAAYQQAVSHAEATDTVLTRAITGRWARGIRNGLIQSIEEAGLPIPAYPVQAMLTASLRASGQVGFLPLWAGQRANQAPAMEADKIIQQLISEAERSYARAMR